VLGKSELEDLPTRIRHAAEQLDWVDRAAVRLREQGHVLLGDVFVIPRRPSDLDAGELVTRLELASDTLCRLDWRLHELIVMPVSRLEEVAPPKT
jgi:hypothetical protein